MAETKARDTAEVADALASKGDVAGETWTGTHDFTGATVTGVYPPSAIAEVTTSQSTTSTSFTDLATAGPNVTLTTGTKALVIISTQAYNNVSNRVVAGFAISGATTVAAADKLSIVLGGSSGNVQVGVSRAVIVTGLTAGSNTFTMKYRVDAGTGTFLNRQITVIDMGS